MYREFIPKCPEDTKLSRHFINLPQVSIVHLEVSKSPNYSSVEDLIISGYPESISKSPESTSKIFQLMKRYCGVTNILSSKFSGRVFINTPFCGEWNMEFGSIGFASLNLKYLSLSQIPNSTLHRRVFI